MEGYKQDMPPPCGYAPIIYQRIPLKSGLSPKLKLLLAFVGTGLGLVWLRNSKWQLAEERLRDWSAHSALMPMILAENDRILLKQLKKNRDAEERIMKDVKGWEVGKWQHLPVYLSFGPDEYFKPSKKEYFMHAEDKELEKHTHVFMYN